MNLAPVAIMGTLSPLAGALSVSFPADGPSRRRAAPRRAGGKYLGRWIRRISTRPVARAALVPAR